MIEFVKRAPLFSRLNEEQLHAIAQKCTKRSYKGNTVLFKEKEPGAAFYIVMKGSVKIYTADISGGEKILSIFKPGESFGELSLIDGKPRSASAQTLEDSELIELTGQHFLDLLRDNFDIALCIMQELGNRLRDTNQHVFDLTFLDARTRVIKSLITMANKHGIRNGYFITIKLVLNFDEISQLAGVQKNTLMTVVRDLEEKGIIAISPTEFKLDLSKLH